ncbi:spore germination protein [Bacillus sp. AFS017336]|uniref:spore germination protein n=1 Tax=Bacillus sp. AFS017336 TaxID=2033489 RepID=UPI000BF0BCA8|nr:spore germination protein [Bacillus sp. AFS017336]PEL10470.1 spore gernimation protein GerA [Bacillus sp. AFS017336]
MQSIVEEIKNHFKNDDDFFILKEHFVNAPVVLLGFKSLVDIPKTLEAIQNKIESIFLIEKTFDQLMHWIGLVKENNLNEAISALVEGNLLILLQTEINKYVIVEPVSQSLNRAVSLPTNENVIQGPLNSFTEDINTNIGIVRKQISSEKLHTKSYSVGTKRKRNLSVLYFENNASMAIFNNFEKQIEKNLSIDINNLQDFSKMLGFSPWIAVSKFNSTELPQEATNALLKGRVIVFVDRIALALVLPGLFWDMFALENDRNYPIPLTITMRSLRIIGFLLALILPALYVALVAVNPEVLRIEIALSIAQSRNGVPYPALVEIILMLIILELIIEASIRLPKSVGPTITMVGGIIIGQAVVEAKLVSNLLIIILAATTIANSTIVGFQNSYSIRLFKYVVAILAAFYGILGIMAGIVLVCTYLSGISTFGIPYLSINSAKEEN